MWDNGIKKTQSQPLENVKNILKVQTDQEIIIFENKKFTFETL